MDTKRTTIRIESALLKDAKSYSRAKNISFQQLVNWGISELLYRNTAKITPGKNPFHDLPIIEVKDKRSTGQKFSRDVIYGTPQI